MQAQSRIAVKSDLVTQGCFQSGLGNIMAVTQHENLVPVSILCSPRNVLYKSYKSLYYKS